MIVFSNTVTFPCFVGETADIQHVQFAISGFIFHLGDTPHSGHYRAAVRCKNQWLVYEDGRLPDKHVDLPETILRNIVLFWLHPVNGISARDREELQARRNQRIMEIEDTQTEVAAP
jgi:hypothetical protein